MPEPSTVLSAWQLAVIALAAVAALTALLVAVFLAARPGAAGTEQPATTAEPEPARPAGRREAA